MYTDTRPPLTRPSTPTRPPIFESAPDWMRWSGAALVGYTLFLLTPTGAAVGGTALEHVASIGRLAIEAAAFFWAAARPDLPRRLVLALQITGWTSVGTALNYLALVPGRLGGPMILTPTVDSALTLASYVGALAALLVYPRAAARPGERWALAIDALVTTGGISVLSWTLVTQPSHGLATDPMEQVWIRMFGLAQLTMLAGLNLVVVRGLAVPSPRAFWWFIVGQSLYLPVVFLSQLAAARLIPAWPIDTVYFLGVLPTLVACHAIRTDPMAHPLQNGGPSWLRDLNPIPLTMPLVVGLALLGTLAFGPPGRAVMLASALVAISLMLAARLLLSAHHSAQLARAEAEREQRRQADRLKALGRLAGGIAHEFNNLMARVIGNTELGEASLPATAEARDYFVRARAAALRAAELTSQLLTFSGQQRNRLERLDAEATVHACYTRTIGGLPAGVLPDLQRGDGPFAVVADAAQLSAALEQVLDNAVEAMPQGGRLTVRVAREQVTTPLPMAHLAVPPGVYVVIAVSDTGIGMTDDAAAAACDPFYSTKSPHLGAGLGLASVHGFIVSHAGGLAIESAPGLGTTVRLYLPAA